MKAHEIYIRRALDLASIGHHGAASALNLGVVIVHHNRVIGESFASSSDPFVPIQEAIDDIHDLDRHLLEAATIYLSHLPNALDQILECGAKRFVYSNPTSFEKQTYQAKGVEVIPFPKAFLHSTETLSRFQACWIKNQRPHIVLKYAQSKDGFIGRHGESVWLTNSFSKRLVHKWRGELGAILVGTNTARIDDPALTNRFFPQLPQPLRIVLDCQNTLSRHLQLFDDQHPTWIVTTNPPLENDYQNIQFIHLDFKEDLLAQLLDKLYQADITSLLVEGGAQLLNGFIEQNLWDEARIFTSPKHLSYGIPTPQIDGQPEKSFKIGEDRLDIFYQNG